MFRLAWRHSVCRDSFALTTRSLAAALLGPERSQQGPLRSLISNPLSYRSPVLQPQPARYLSPPVCRSMASGGEQESTCHKHTNRLAKERSPYLLQHAHNPVDWYPWGQEAFEKAKTEDKPIFLSVGYSTCHWCHVMERESFQDEEIGKILSDNFICIKLDREERPDVDKVYMTFVQATSGGGGWPMSVWLTPELKPFIGGTYFPPRDQGRRPGFRTVLMRIIEQWQNNRAALESSGERILVALRKGTSISANPGGSPPLAPDVANRCFQQLAHSYEEEYGGFRNAPKFPSPVNLMFLMSYWSVNRSTSEGVEALQMAMHTLRMMALGGIHDHVAQGFHRYSTDSSWHVPHFEKMLYDQAQLAVAYITAFQVSGEQFYADVAKNILLYVSRDLSDKDPQGELQGQNVLIVRYSVELTAARFGITVEKVNHLLASARAKMADMRITRPRPHLDTKMLASWNGLMLSAFARVGAVLGDEALLERAKQAGNFLKEHLWDSETQTILRSCCGGEQHELQQMSPSISGFLDDYAFIICGLLDLYEATFQTEWLQWAEELQLRQDLLFWDDQGGGYFCSDPSDSTILLQLKEDQDGAEPSANSVSASNLLRLSHYTGNQEWLQKSQQLLTAFSDRLARVPIALPEMVRALMAQHYTLKQIVICGQRDDSDTAGLLAAVNSLYLPFKVLMLTDGSPESFLCQRLPVLSSMFQLDGVATAHVCQDFTCSLPVTDPQELRRLLLDGATDS
ncbi:spermatogenesis-associated protein 20 isoform X3 [Nothobranchius furzeri]|uniref:Spermatogenesis associated 20 n=1 Tax=Nothobranchius furzeri TaxID=105023 RepID=A0A1A7ZKD9_NOTFU|nr:transcript variant X3 [Nothobranchius furzeri]